MSSVGLLCACDSKGKPSAQDSTAVEGEGDNARGEAAAIKATDAWLRLVDAGQYAESWREAAPLFKGAVTEHQWAAQVGAVRKPLGAVVSRTLKSATPATSLPGAPDGHYVVIQYDTVFAHKQHAVETVTPMLDKAGQWRVSGYFVR